MFVLLLLLIARNNVLRTTADTAAAMIDVLQLPPLKRFAAPSERMEVITNVRASISDGNAHD